MFPYPARCRPMSTLERGDSSPLSNHASGPPRSPRNYRCLAKHYHSRAALAGLFLAGLRPPTPHRSLRSLRRRGFAHYVRLRHYRSSLLAGASNSLTFVRGADRACCAPRKWQCSLTCMPRKWSCRPTTACLYQPPHALRRGIGVRTRQRHLAACFMAFAVFSKRPTPIIPKSDAIVNRCGGIFYDFFKLVRGRRGNSAFMGSAESGGRNSVTGVKLAVEIRQRLVAAAQRDLQNRQ